MSLLIASFPETKEIAQHVARALKAHYVPITVEDFPDSEFHISLKDNPKNKTVVIINSLSGDPNRKIVETLLAGGIAKDYHAKKVILVATYLPYMRQDTHFFNYDSFSSLHILEMFSHFDKIIAVDPHLHRLHSMRQISKHATSITTNKLIANYIRKRFKDDFTIVGPDKESAQWSQKIADMLNKKVVILEKTRFSSEHIKQKEKKLGKNIIIIDDIISTGRTISGALKMAKKQGAKKIICIGIHGVLVKNADTLITKYAELITTNTIPNKYAQIDISPLIADALKKGL
ncbi:ribose-phosphate diphosphokinase [Candidatus Pacearchaeota archaeon]|nr:ribose-phosphate diphosphokinase [Candidatus Pacearchaeota archaeon]